MWLDSTDKFYFRLIKSVTSMTYKQESTSLGYVTMYEPPIHAEILKRQLMPLHCTGD